MIKKTAKQKFPDQAMFISIDKASTNYVSGWIITDIQFKNELRIELATSGFKPEKGLICDVRNDVKTAENQICLGFAIIINSARHQIGESSVITANAGKHKVLKSLEQIEVDGRYLEFIVHIEELNSKTVSGWIGFLRPSARGRNLYISSESSKKLISLTEKREDVSAITGIRESYGFRCDGVSGESVSVVDSDGIEYFRYSATGLNDRTNNRSVLATTSALFGNTYASNTSVTAAELLSQFRIDSNNEFVFMADPKFEIPTRTNLRADSNEILYLAKEGKQSSLYDDNSKIIDQARVGSDLQNIDLSQDINILAMSWKNSDMTECELTKIQVIYAQTQKQNCLFTDDDYASILAMFATDICRGVISGFGLLTESQVCFLNEIHPLGRQSIFQLNRYQVARHRMDNNLTGSRERFDLYSQALLFVNSITDEIYNGFGTLLINKDSIMVHEHLRMFIRELCFLAQRIPESKTGIEFQEIAEDLIDDYYNEWYEELRDSHFLKTFLQPNIDQAIKSLSDKNAVAVIGTVGHGSGVGKNADNSMFAISNSGLRAEPMSLNVSSGNFSLEVMNSKFPRVDSYLVHLQPDLFSIFVRSFPRPVGIRKLIGFFAWETQNVPSEFSRYFHLLDEIWTPSDYAAEAFRKCFSGTINVVPHAIIPAKASGMINRESLGISKNRFVFYFSFDAHSSIYRKNPIAVLKSIDRLNSQGLQPLLLLKIRNFDQIVREFENGSRIASDFLELLWARTDVVLITEDLNVNECQDLMDLSDAYVSLHRSEGFGYTMAEAMASNKPTIATGFSGNLQFMNEKNSWLVNFRNVDIDNEIYPWSAPTDFWAEPDLDDACEAMRIVMLGGPEVSERASRGCADIRERFSLDAMSAKYLSYLSS
jgi:glycosyltransferase involved in cell wall biosynthesis